MIRRVSPPALAAVLVLGVALIAGCGGDSSETTTTDTIKDNLQLKLDDATQSCKDSAAQISNSTLRTATESACAQLSSELAKDVDSAIDSAQGNLHDSLINLAEECEKSISSLPAGQDAAKSLCNAISSSVSSVSPG